MENLGGSNMTEVKSLVLFVQKEIFLQTGVEFELEVKFEEH